MDYSGSKIAVYNDQGIEIECDVISVFKNEETGKSYLIYTDNSKNEYGGVNMFVVSYRPDVAEEEKLYPIQSEEEWMSIAPMLEEIRDAIDKNQKASEEPSGCSPSCCASCSSSCGE